VDFIERLFGVSPDGGNGVLEAVYLLVPLAVAVIIKFRKDIYGIARRGCELSSGVRKQ
jgi:hypothetical protein